MVMTRCWPSTVICRAVVLSAVGIHPSSPSALLREEPFELLRRRGGDPGGGQVLQDVGLLLHPHQGCPEPRGRADELQGPLRIGPEAREDLSEKRGHPAGQPGLEEGGAGHHVGPQAGRPPRGPPPPPLPPPPPAPPGRRA